MKNVLRRLGLSVAIALVGCAPNCLDPGEVGTVQRVTNAGTLVESVSFALPDGTTRICKVNRASARSIKVGDVFTGPLGGGVDDLGFEGER